MILALSFVDHLESRWKQFAMTIAGGNGRGYRLDQLNHPCGICLDNSNQRIYIADFNNHRVVEWKLNENISRIVAGGNGQGDRFNQLNEPTDVIIDQQNNHFIIADCGNRRVMKWSSQFCSPEEVLIDDIDCMRLAMHKDGTLYVSDWKKNEVRRWKKKEKTRGTIAAGGNGLGIQLNQLNCPTFLFVDDNHTLYISDTNNHRVIKWTEDAKEGVVVAGGQGTGDRLTQVVRPCGVIVDQFGQIYVADRDNHRVMRWREGEKEGTIVVGGYDQGQQKNQLNCPFGLLLDEKRNLYVADCFNHRIEKFERERKKEM